MIQKLSTQDTELFKRVDEVLFYKWDPVNVSDVPEARDEYDEYVPQIFSWLKRSETAQGLSKQITAIEEKYFEEKPTPEMEKRNLEVAELLIGWRECIAEKFEERRNSDV